MMWCHFILFQHYRLRRSFSWAIDEYKRVQLKSSHIRCTHYWRTHHISHHSVKKWLGEFKENQMRNHECIEAKCYKHLASLEKIILKLEFFHSICLLLRWMPKAPRVLCISIVLGVSPSILRQSNVLMSRVFEAKCHLHFSLTFQTVEKNICQMNCYLFRFWYFSQKRT